MVRVVKSKIRIEEHLCRFVKSVTLQVENNTLAELPCQALACIADEVAALFAGNSPQRLIINRRDCCLPIRGTRNADGRSERGGLDNDRIAQFGLDTIKHGVTRYAITLACVEAALAGGAFAPGAYAEAKWVTPAELAAFPVSAPQRKLMTALANPNRQPRLF